jgi:hypothetical protein
LLAVNTAAGLTGDTAIAVTGSKRGGVGNTVAPASRIEIHRHIHVTLDRFSPGILQIGIKSLRRTGYAVTVKYLIERGNAQADEDS